MRPENKYLSEHLAADVKESSGFFLTSYLGLSAETLTKLRNECRNNNCKYVVVKNRVFKIALKEMGIDVPDDDSGKFQQSTAVAFSKEDAIAVAKALVKFGKDNDGLPKIKGGYLEGKWFDEQGVEAFSKLPSREVLLAQLMGTLKAPLNSYVSVLKAPLRNFVYALSQIADQKKSDN